MTIRTTFTSGRVVLLACLLGFQFPARAQTNIYTMPPTEVRGASGRVFILNGSVSSVHVVDGGKGYTTPPNVAIVLTNGSGSGAVVTATVANGSVTGLTLQNPGSYSSPASGILVIDLPPNPLQAVIQSNLYGTIILPAGHFEMTTVVSNNVTIRGQGMNLTTISGGGRGSVFRVTPGKTVAFENLTITRGSATNGGGIYNDAGLVTVQGCRITENEATGLAGEGGGIYNRGSAWLIITNSVVRNNTSKRNGGGISNSGLNTTALPQLGGTLQNLPDTLRGFYTDLQDNVRYGINFTTDYFGNLVANPPDFSKIVRNALSSLNSADFSNPGKIDTRLQEYFGKSQDDSTAPMDDSLGDVVQANGPATITNAMADPYGSGVGGSTGWLDMNAPVLFILNSMITDNRVTASFSGFGGGIHNDLGLVLVANSTIENNLAESNLGTFGGGINSIFGAIRIQNSHINNNTARSKTIFAAGGAVLSFAGFLDVQDSEFRNNQVEAKFLSSGGAIKHTAGARGTIEDTRIIGNRSGGGGGIANDYLAKLTIHRATIESNSVSGIISANGGGIRNDLGGELEISDSTFSFNVATDRSKGGGLYNHAEEQFEFVEQALIAESKVSLVNCTFSSNRVEGTYLKIPNPGSLASCLLAQQYPPYRQCDFNSLPTIDIPLTSRGGAIYNGAEGGGEAELTLSGCTIYGNAATGPLQIAGGVYLTGSAGLNPTNIGLALLKVGNSIVARSTGADFSKDVLPTPASAQSQGGNLDSDGTLYSAVLGSGIATAANPALGPLRNNGGPTRTHSLLTGSPAINTGNSGNCTATDQRGVTRSLGGPCDIGAVEKVNPFGFADSYVALQEQPLVVNADNGVLSNDFADAAIAQLVSGVSNGALSLSADGSFTYTGNTNFSGTNTFSYRLVDGGFQSAPIQVTIVVRPILKIVSTSPVTNRVDAPLNSDVVMALNHSLNAATVPGSVKVRGSQSRVPNAPPAAGGATITVNPAVDFRPGEAVSVSVLKSLRGANGAELLKPAQWQFTADVLRGDGRFKPGPLFGTFGSEGAAVGDFDGDGDLDIFVAKRAEGDQVWRNDGNGVFTMAQSFRDNSSGAAVGDVDGDGDLDIVVAKRGGFDEVVPAVTVEYHCVLRNNGLGFFSETGQKIIPDTFRDALSPDIPEPFRYTSLVGATGVKLADLNGDGNLDILFLGGLSYSFYLYRTPGNHVWLNNGSGYFEPAGQPFGDTITYDAALGDLDGDGDLDVFTANSYSSGINVPSQVWLNDGGGHFSLGYQTDAFWGRAIALGDLDRDGDLDAVICGAAPDPVLGLANRTRILTNNGLASFNAVQFVGEATTESVAITDLNADGHLDLLLAQGFATRPWTNNGSGSFTWNGTALPNQKATELCPGDFDGDGDADLVVANARQPGDVSTPNAGVQNQIWYNNNFPVATNDIYNLAEDGFLSAPSVLANDSDADGDALVAETTTTIVHRGTLGQLIGLFGAANNYPYEGTYPSGSYVYNQVVPLFSTNGTLTFFSNGTFTYRPNTNFAGTDVFQYVVTDGYLRRTGTVTLTVAAVNDPPLARDDYYSISGTNLVVNAAGGVLANDTDVEGTVLTASVVTLPGHGSLTLNADGSFTYTRNVGWTGTDSFVYRASDGPTNAIARVKIGNAAPLAANDNYALPGSSLTINAAAGVLVNDTDPDGDTNFTAVLATPPGFGTLQLNANGSFTYNRATNHSGNDSFTYFASDGFDLSQPARVKLGNAAPVALTNSYNAFSGTALIVPVAQGVLANDTDADGDMLAAVLVAPPTNGVLTLSSNGSFSYTANGNFSGIDSFIYRATDGLLNSSSVAVTFTVNGRLQVVAVSPTIHAINAATNSSVEITFNVPPSLPTVTSNRVLIYGSLSGYHSWSPAVSSNKLILSLTTPFRVGESVRVALQPGIRGTGLFELETSYAWNFTIGSPRGGLNFTEITPSPTNHTNVRVALGDVNGDGRLDAITVGGFDAPGVLYLNNGGGSFTERLVGGEGYRHIALGDLDRDGDLDAFVIGTYRERWLNDGAGNFTSTQMPFVNPLITHVSLADLDRDGDLDVFLAAVDFSIPAGQGIVWSLLNDGAGNFTEGAQTFTVNSVTSAALGDLDNDGDVDAYLVGLNGDLILFNNGSGVFTAGMQTIDTSFNQDVDLNDLDGDGDVDAFVVTGDGNRAGRIYYNDGAGRFLPSGLSPQPRRLSVALALGDVNGDGLLDGVEAVQLGLPGPLPGTNSVWLNTGTGHYTNRTFAVSAGDSQHVALGDLDNDGDLDAFFANGQGTPTVNRIWINQSAPQARDDFYAANGVNPVVIFTPGVLANDGAGDGGSLRALLDTLPTKGSVTLNTNGSFTYTPGGAFAGADVFTYYATDSSQTSRIARVKIGNIVPSATNDGVYVAIGGTPLNVTAAGGVLANDADPEGDPLTALLNAGPTHGSLQLKPNGSFVYTATNAYVGADSFTYRAHDGVSNSTLATVTFDVRNQLVLLERTPAPNELRARTDANVVLRFNAALNPASVSNNVVVAGSVSGPVAFTSTPSSNVLTLNPVAEFFVGEQITILLTDDLEGSSSQRLAKPLVWQFNVEAPFGRGNLTDSASPLVNTNCSTGRVLFGDFNRDSYLDVLCVNNRVGQFTNRFGGSNTVWFGTAQGTLVDSGQRFLGANVPNGYFSTTMGDIDGDGDMDLVSRLLGGRHDFWTNNGAGFFGLNNTISNAVWDGAAELGDLDGDKDLDLFILGASDVSILTNNGTGQFTSTGQVLQPGTSLQFVALGDLDGDGDMDAIVQPFFAGARILLNNGVAVFSDSGQALGLGGQRVCLGDFDGDADLDFIQSRNPSLLFVNDGQGNFTQSSQVFDPFTTQEIKPADLDGDGDLDLVVQASEFINSTNANRTKIWYNDGAGNFTPTAIAFGSVQIGNFGVADVNRDGALDVLVNRSTFVDPLPVERWFNSIALGLVEGGTTLTINDTQTTTPFTNIVLRSPPSLNVSLQVRLDNIAKGSFTPASLSAAGFTGPIGNTYSRAAGSAATAQAALRQLVFAPTQNRQPVGQFELTAFSIEATDGTTSRTNGATVVTSISVNTPPVANNDGGAGFSTTESATFTTANVLANDLDVDPQDVLTIQSINAAGLPGTLNPLGNGTFQFNPGANFVSLPLGVTTNRTFQYTVSDVSGALATATVTLTITGQNSAPMAANDTIMVGEKAGTVIITSQMMANDFDVDAGEQQTLIVSAINTNGTSGIVTLLAGDAVSYNRNGVFGNVAPGATTNTTFGYTLRDVHNATSNATVTLTIVGTNDAPVAQDDVITLSEIVASTNVTARLLTNDSDPDPGHTATLAVSGIDTANTLGSVLFTNQSVIYSPNGQFDYLTNGQSATDSFTYFITDTSGATASALLTVTILGANTPPAAGPDEIVLPEDAGPTNVTALLLANDSDNDTNQTASLAVNGIALTNTTGAVTFSNGVVTYTPSTNLNLIAGQITNDTFLYVVRDSQGLTATNSATVTILGVNDAPVAATDTLQVNEDSSAINITGLLLANDADPNPGDAASLIIDGVFTNGTIGAITLTNGLLYYNPSGRFFLPPGVTNTDAFLYSVRDRFGSNSIAAVTVTVIGEFSRPGIIISSIVVQTNRHVRLSHNGGDEGYSVQVSTNLVQWQVLGPSTLIGPGLFEYLDTTAPPFGRRYYRILVGPPPIAISSIVIETNGHVRLRHNGTNGTYTVQVSTNLVQWQVLGTSTLLSPGLFQYVDLTAPPAGRRFYRVRSP